MLLLYLCTLISPHTTQCTPLADLHTLRKTYIRMKVLVPNNILASEYFLSTRNLFEIMLSYIFPSNVTITCTYEISRMKGSSTYFLAPRTPTILASFERTHPRKVHLQNYLSILSLKLFVRHRQIGK